MDSLRPPHHTSALAQRLQTPSLTSTTSARSSTSSMFASGSGASSPYPYDYDSGLGSTTVGGRASPPPLIDLDGGMTTPSLSLAPRRPIAFNAGAGATPTDKLRLLLRQMDAEVRTASQPTPYQRRGVDIGTDDEPTPIPRGRPYPIPVPPIVDIPSGPSSPPTPPPRLTSHLYSRRAAERREVAAAGPSEPASPPRRYLKRERPPQPGEPSSPPPRLPSPPPRHLTSRAIALRAATAAVEAKKQATQALPDEVRERSAPTPLENFIASSAPPTPFADPSSSRRPLSLYEATPRARPPRRSTPSPSPPSRKRKGKEPAYSVSETESEQNEPVRAREPSPEPEEPEPPRRRGITPRRRIATPPNTSASFVAGLNTARELDLDLGDETVQWRDEDETVESSDSSVPVDMKRGPTRRFREQEELSLNRSRESLPSAESRSPSASRTFATATEGTIRERRASFDAHSQTRGSADMSLPALPDPVNSSSEEDEERSSARERRRNMFRPSKSPEPEGEAEPPRSRSRSWLSESAPRNTTAYSDARSEVAEPSSYTEARTAETHLPRYASLRPERQQVPATNDARLESRLLSSSQLASSEHSSRLGSSAKQTSWPGLTHTSRFETSPHEEESVLSDDEPSRRKDSRAEPSRQESSLLGAFQHDSSFLDLGRQQPTLAELSTRVETTMFASRLPHSRSDSRDESHSQFQGRDYHRLARTDDSDTIGGVHGALSAPDGDDFDDHLDAVPQSSPPRVSPNKSLRSSIGKASLRGSSRAPEWAEDAEEETARVHDSEGEGEQEVALEELVGTDLGTEDEADWRPDGPDTTSDSWRELEAERALNPPTPSPRNSPRKSREHVSPAGSSEHHSPSPALADSDTLPETPPTMAVPRRSFVTSQARSLLRAATSPTSGPSSPSAPTPAAAPPTPASAPVAPTPLRSALRKRDSRFDSRFAPVSPSVRWSPDVLDNTQDIDDTLSEEPAEAQPESQPAPSTPIRGTTRLQEEPEAPSTSPRSSPPRHVGVGTPAKPTAAPDEAFMTPVRAPAGLPLRTPKPPGGWSTPWSQRDVPPISGLPPSTPLPAPPAQAQTPGLPTPKPPGAWASTPAALPPSTPLPAPPQAAVAQTPGLTPRPPGAYVSQGRAYAAHVPARTSRLRNEVRLDESTSSNGSDISVHRLRISPKRRKGKEKAEEKGLPNDSAAAQTPQAGTSHPQDEFVEVPLTSPPPQGVVKNEPKDEPEAAEAGAEDDEPADADTSWTARLSRLVAPMTPLSPTKSRSRLAEAQNALDTASKASAKARSRVLKAQDAWRAAIATTPPEPAPAPKPAEPAVVSSAKRGLWAAWIVLELVLLWVVFRVTLEYASSSTFLSRSDPFGPFAPSYAVGVRLPASLEAFGRHSRASANIFDILDALGLGLELGAPPRRWTPPS